ncbi:MAG: DUF2442 domain-containing protein [Campylobacterales bacterium]|nr:DUF2442 domain-containing protein [Campylobacterales bacterium]
MILHITHARHLHDYQLEVTFNNGITKIVDLQNELDGEIFEPLKNLEQFQKVYLDCGTIAWENGADFAPEYLYLISQPISSQQEDTPLREKINALYAS